MSDVGGRRPIRSRAAVFALGLALLVLASLPFIPGSRASSAGSVTGSVTGASTVGEGLKANYVVTGTGGPAIAANGSQVGVFTFHAYYVAPPGVNTTGALLSPPSGVLVNGTVTLQFTAPNATGTATIAVLLNSSYQSHWTLDNVTTGVSVVQPMRIGGTLQVGRGGSVAPFGITVTLDGTPVGTIQIPTLAAGATYPVNFAFVAPGLGPGWHTIAMSVAPEHGLITFSGGTEAVTSNFYVPGPAPNNTVYYVGGIAAFLGALVIWGGRVGPRRRRPKT
ncbi:MAG TPA: hypothetical protein VFF67_06940 [Thermoplasmata archaeon]|nr:hypothetical protein [Thermoplasmata archaeon]